MPKRKTEETPPPDAEALALKLLARREHGRKELAGKLARRGVPAEEIEPTLDRLEADGLLSEARFVEQFVALRLRQGYGPLHIRGDLAAKGLDPGSADAALAFDDEEWAARAEAARRRRFGGGIPSDYDERARQARFLERRGYTAAHIARVLRGVGEPEN